MIEKYEKYSLKGELNRQSVVGEFDIIGGEIFGFVERILGEGERSEAKMITGKLREPKAINEGLKVFEIILRDESCRCEVSKVTSDSSGFEGTYFGRSGPKGVAEGKCRSVVKLEKIN